MFASSIFLSACLIAVFLSSTKNKKICYIYLQDALYPFVYTSIQITQYNIYMIVLLKLKFSFNDNVKMSPSYVAYI